MSHTEPVLTADKNCGILREEDSASLKSSLMIGLVLVILFLLISGWNAMIEPIDDLNDSMFYMQFIVSTVTFRQNSSITIRIRGHMNTYA